MADTQPIIGIVVTLLIAIAVMTLLIRLLINRPTPRPVRVRAED